MATIEEKAKAYDEKLDVARHIYADPSVKDEDKYYIEVIFPELKESEDERIIKMSGVIGALEDAIYDGKEQRRIIIDCGGIVHIRDYVLSECGDYKEGDRVVISIAPCGKDEYHYPPRPKDDVEAKEMIAWLEKKDRSSDQIHYWTEEEIEPIISDYLRGAEHYGGMIARLRCLKPKSLGKQGEQSKKHDVCDTCDEKDSCISPCCVKLVEEQGGQKPVGFNIGDEITVNGQVCRIVAVDNLDWGKEDEAVWSEISDLLWEGYKQSGSKFSWDDIRNWANSKLKYIRPQKTWKPSDEQMKALSNINVTGCISYAEQGQELVNLYNDLKKLRKK